MLILKMSDLYIIRRVVEKRRGRGGTLAAALRRIERKRKAAGNERVLP